MAPASAAERLAGISTGPTLLRVRLHDRHGERVYGNVRLLLCVGLWRCEARSAPWSAVERLAGMEGEQTLLRPKLDDSHSERVEEGGNAVLLLLESGGRRLGPTDEQVPLSLTH